MKAAYYEAAQPALAAARAATFDWASYEEVRRQFIRAYQAADATAIEA